MESNIFQVEKLKDLELIENYVYDYFQFKDRWQVTPIDDMTHILSWYILDGILYYKEDNEDYELEIIDDCILEKQGYTAVLINIRADQNPNFLSIFDNSYKIK